MIKGATWRGLILAIGAAMTALSTAALAQSEAPSAPFAERLVQLRAPLQVRDRDFAGPGAAILTAAIKSSRYVLIGEDHLTREIPQFTANLCRTMAVDGLGALAVEVGPEAADIVDANLRRPDRLERIGRFMHEHPDAMAFQNGRDESDMAAACAGAAGSRFRLWGLDQEFFGAAGNILERMLAAKPGPTARAAIERLLAAERAATAAALASGSPGQLLIYAASDQQLGETRAAITKDGGPRVLALFAGLEKTREIYLKQNTDPYASNGERARLMKRTLVTYLDSVRPTTRVLFKFGDAHMRKGLNGLGQRDLGNFVAERAEGEGARSLHLLVLGRRGTHALYNGVGRQARQEPFVLSDDADFAWLKDVMPAAGAAATDWTLLDLRPLRERPPRAMPAAWRHLVDGFDMVVIASEITPSSLVGTR